MGNKRNSNCTWSMTSWGTKELAIVQINVSTHIMKLCLQTHLTHIARSRSNLFLYHVCNLVCHVLVASEYHVSVCWRSERTLNFSLGRCVTVESCVSIGKQWWCRSGEAMFADTVKRTVAAVANEEDTNYGRKLSVSDTSLFREGLLHTASSFFHARFFSLRQALDTKTISRCVSGVCEGWWCAIYFRGRFLLSDV